VLLSEGGSLHNDRFGSMLLKNSSSAIGPATSGTLRNREAILLCRDGASRALIGLFQQHRPKADIQASASTARIGTVD
jgi:hypothetical protein